MHRIIAYERFAKATSERQQEARTKSPISRRMNTPVSGLLDWYWLRGLPPSSGPPGVPAAARRDAVLRVLRLEVDALEPSRASPSTVRDPLPQLEPSPMIA